MEENSERPIVRAYGASRTEERGEQLKDRRVSRVSLEVNVLCLSIVH